MEMSCYCVGESQVARKMSCYYVGESHLVREMSCFCVGESLILDSSCFSFFHSGQVFHKMVCAFTFGLSHIFFNLTTLFSLSVFCCHFHAPLDVVVHLPVFLRSFKFKLFFLSSLHLSHRSRISAVSQVFFF